MKLPACPQPFDRPVRRVAVLPFPGIDGAFLCLSAQKKGDPTEGLSPYRATVTFTLVRGDHQVDWEPEYGPIQTNELADAAADGLRAHWTRPFATENGLNWSQMAVETRGLPEAFARGDYEYIFSVLAEWLPSDRGDDDA